MIFFRRNNVINESTSQDDLKKELNKTKGKLSKKTTRFEAIKKEMDSLYKAAMLCDEESINYRSNGNSSLAAKKLSEKMKITKRYASVKGKVIDLGREIDFLNMRIDKIGGLLGN